jgi:hypothetical protein
VLLDANENAYGPGLALSNEGALQASQTGDATGASKPEIDFLGLNRYPDPLVSSIPRPMTVLGLYEDCRKIS